MSRWLLALLFAFGTVTFLTGCPAEEEAPAEEAATEAVEGAEAAAEEGAEAAADAVDAVTE